MSSASSITQIPPAEDQRLARGRETRAHLLAAAIDVLGEDGYAAMSMRSIADRAGVPLSLLHYHFGSKQRLLAAVLEHLTQGLLQRQQSMWTDGRSFAEQWRTACDYLREDVRTGYVRTLWEIWSAGLANPELAERWRVTQHGWRELIVQRLERWQQDHDLQLPMSPRALATLIGNLFEGAETEMLAGVGPDVAPHLEALEALGNLIERAERG